MFEDLLSRARVTTPISSVEGVTRASFTVTAGWALAVTLSCADVERAKNSIRLVLFGDFGG